MSKKLIAVMIVAFVAGLLFPLRHQILRGYAEFRVWNRQVEMQIEREAYERQYGPIPPTFTEVGK